MSESKFLLIKKEEFNKLLKNIKIIKDIFDQLPCSDSFLNINLNDMIYKSRIFILETIISMIIDIKNFKIKKYIMITSQFYDIIDDNKKKELDNFQETELLNHIKKLLSISISLRELYGQGKSLNETQQKLVYDIYMIKLYSDKKNNLIKLIINF